MRIYACGLSRFFPPCSMDGAFYLQVSRLRSAWAIPVEISFLNYQKFWSIDVGVGISVFFQSLRDPAVWCTLG